MIKTDSMGCVSEQCMLPLPFDGSLAEIHDGLGQNYPNPFVDGTWVPYRLPSEAKEGWVVFYDVMGRKVMEKRVKERLGEVFFRLREGQSGVLFYTLEVGSEIIGKRTMIRF